MLFVTIFSCSQDIQNYNTYGLASFDEGRLEILCDDGSRLYESNASAFDITDTSRVYLTFSYIGEVSNNSAIQISNLYKVYHKDITAYYTDFPDTAYYEVDTALVWISQYTSSINIPLSFNGDDGDIMYHDLVIDTDRNREDTLSLVLVQDGEPSGTRCFGLASFNLESLKPIASDNTVVLELTFNNNGLCKCDSMDTQILYRDYTFQ